MAKKPLFANPLNYRNLGEKEKDLKWDVLRCFDPYESFIYNYMEYLDDIQENFNVSWEKVPKDDIEDLPNLPEEGIAVRIFDDEIDSDIDEKIDRFLDMIDEEIVYFDSSSKKHRRLEVIRIYPEEEILFLEKIPKGPRLFPDNFSYKSYREKEAIKMLMNKPQPHHLSLLKLSKPVEEDESIFPDFELPNIKKWNILTNNHIKGIRVQRKMVKKALGTPDFAILEGPPGSGKTTVISEIILQMISRGERILLAGSTHVSVDNVLEKIIKDHLDKVVPLRVNSGGRYLPDDIRQFTYKNIVKTKKEEILGKLQLLGNDMSPAQNEWFKLIQSDEADEVLENIIMDSVNLVCGTTIGVLQHHEIKNSIKNTPAIFDCMILDEASKTTFSEFLVPALYAKKWIISGDPRQLSPYVERSMITQNIRAEIEDALKDSKLDYDDVERLCLGAFNFMKNKEKDKRTFEIKDIKNNAGVFLPVEDGKEIYAEKLVEHLSEVGYDKPNIYDGIENSDLDPKNRGLHYDTSEMIIEPIDILKDYKQYIPGGLYPFDEKADIFPNHRRKTEYHKHNSGIKHWHYPWDYVYKSNDKSLDDQIAWRIIRFYETKEDEEMRESYGKDIKALLPHWSLEQDKDEEKIKIHQKLIDTVFKIRSICLPSIVECLLEGNNLDILAGEIVLKNGLPPADKEKRHCLLEYQHRMHPDISKYPREMVYLDENGEPVGMYDGKIKRSWDYKKYKSRIVWISPKRGKEKYKRKSKYNPGEIKELFRELDSFKKFARKHKSERKSGLWDVAIISMYKGQTKKILKRLRKKYNKKSGHRFVDKKNNVNIFVGNVDSMQGREADIIFLSLVRTKKIGFLDNYNRINVAITRARYQLVIIGDQNFFKNHRRSNLLIVKLAKKISGEIDIGYDPEEIPLPIDEISQYDPEKKEKYDAVIESIEILEKEISEIFDSYNDSKRRIGAWHNGDKDIDIDQAHRDKDKYKKIIKTEIDSKKDKKYKLIKRKRKLEKELRG